MSQEPAEDGDGEEPHDTRGQMHEASEADFDRWAERYDEIVEEAKAASDPLELEDVVFLLEKVLEAYGVTAGES